MTVRRGPLRARWRGASGRVPDRTRSRLAAAAALVMLALAAGGCGGGSKGATEPSPETVECSGARVGVTIYDPERCEPGYTLLSSLGGHENPAGSRVYHGAILVDMDGRLIHEWAVAGVPAKLLPDGHLLGFRALREDGTIHQEMTALVEVDWEGNEVWRWDRWGRDTDGHSICRCHHDFQREGIPEAAYGLETDPESAEQGNTLVLVHDNVDRPDISPWTLEDDVIVEVNREGEVLWEWHASDHFEEFGFDEPARQALKTIQVFIPPDALTPGAGITDWLHVNTVSRLGPNKWWEGGGQPVPPGQPDCLLPQRGHCLDHREIHGPDRLEGRPRLRPEARLGQFVGQHHAHMIAEGLPGAGNILAFDNGGLAGYGRMFGTFGPPFFPNQARTYSRVIEFDPVTLRIVWEYKRPGSGWGDTIPFFSVYISGAQRLLNGNTLITDGDSGRVFEVTPEGETVWEYYSPFHDFSSDRFTLPALRCDTDLYRAYRIPYDYLPGDLLG